MKAISLIQPWATFVMWELKKLETRSWRTKHRGPIAIHSSMSRPKCAHDLYYSKELRPFLEPFSDRLSSFDSLPRGCVLGTVSIAGVAPTEDCPWPHDGVEGLLGDYRPGRFAWLLISATPFVEPIPMKGSRLIFEVGKLKGKTR